MANIGEYFYIRSKLDESYVLEVTEEGLVINPENGGHAQMWKWTAANSLVSKTGMAIDMTTKDDEPPWETGGKLIGWKYQGGDNQVWKKENEQIVDINDPHFVLEVEGGLGPGARVNAAKGKCGVLQHENCWRFDYIPM